MPSRRATRTVFSVALVLAALGLFTGCSSGSSHKPSKPSVTASSPVSTPTEGGLPACGVECDPIDPRYLTSLPFGASSFWIQPWRAYLDTWPGSRLLDALGVNFNVNGNLAPDVARLLHDVGFRLARIEIGWGALSYANPERFVHEAEIRARLLALRRYGLRPLILLNANSGEPAPAKKIALTTVAPAPAGSTTVTLTAASAAEVVPGKSGFDSSTFKPVKERHKRGHKRAQAGPRLTPAQRRVRHAARRAARKAATAAGLTTTVLQGNPGLLITKVSAGGVATLSRPLPSELPAGSYRGSTLLYAPFGPPKLPNGSPNPAFKATLAGWLQYVATICREARGIFGARGFDLEVWNELSFGSEFLDVEKYYADPESSSREVVKEVTKTLLDETLAFVRNPANGISSQVGVSDGFASESPFPSAAYAPAGLTAYSKHPYAGPKSYPADFHAKPGNVPRDALGRRDTTGERHSAEAFAPRFVPTFQADLPEHTLTAASTETLVRDLAPFVTDIYQAPHGRTVARAGQPPPQTWVTEYNLGTAGGVVVGPDEATPQTGSSAALTTADKAHFQAKVALRSLVSMVGAGVSREYFYAAAYAGDLSLIAEPFVSKANAQPSVFPGDAAGGEAMAALHRMLTHFNGPGPQDAGARQLTLLSITQDGNHAQFTGDGTGAHPDLYDRDVLAVFPFQTSPTTFVIPVYVMTRDMLTLYEPNAPATDVHRFDLPDETFHITLGNLPSSATPPTVSAYDPLLDETTRAHLTGRTGNQATFELTATDYPRLLTLEYKH
ncbi:MAG TPA: hypothetical protein VNR42_05935 [Solirubrobacteraceae bacterium]|nr:hypothetical protein [Solirubrobacteraceae bacterium]